MATRYDPQIAEQKWRAAWDKAALFTAKSPAEDRALFAAD